MPSVTLTLISQRSRLVTDAVEWIEARGRLFGRVNPADIILRKESGEVIFDVAPDRYTIRIDVPGFFSTKRTIDVGKSATARNFELENRCTLLPKVGDLSSEQKRLLQTLDGSKMPGAIWAALTDNKAATFFQVTTALADTSMENGDPLSTIVDRIVHLGGSELIAPDPDGVMRTVIGWRMHVIFGGEESVQTKLLAMGFKRDTGLVHHTHKRFGFSESFREKSGAPKMQVVTNHAGTSADVDLDAGVFHKSSPHDIYKNFAKRFPDAADVYVVE